MKREDSCTAQLEIKYFPEKNTPMLEGKKDILLTLTPISVYFREIFFVLLFCFFFFSTVRWLVVQCTVPFVFFKRMMTGIDFRQVNNC